jgi:maleate isomerase
MQMKYKGKRLGLLLPASNSTMEKELMQYLPKGVSLHVSRMHVGKVTADELLAMSKQASQSGKLLAECKPDLILYGCTSGSFILGKGFDLNLEKDITEATNVPAITTSHAVLNLLDRFGIRKVAVGTPYIDEVNQRLHGFLQDNGYSVVKMKGLGYENNLDIGNLSPWDAISLAQDIDSNEADGMFLSCTNMSTIEALPAMWELFKKPVISSNYASLLEALRLLGYPAKSWLGMEMGEELIRRCY